MNEHEKLVDAEQSAVPEEDLYSRTELGRRLWRARQEYLASGEPLLDAEGIEKEVAERRGGVSQED